MITNYLLNSLQDYALFILHLLVILQRLFTLHLLTKLQSKIEVSISIGFVFFEILYFLTIPIEFLDLICETINTKPVAKRTSETGKTNQVKH